MSTYAVTSYTLAAMVAAFVLSSWRFKSPELSMVVTALVGALVAGLGHLAGVKGPVFAILFIIIGASIILRPLFARRPG